MNRIRPLWSLIAVGSAAVSGCATVTVDKGTDDTPKKDWRDVCTPESDDTDLFGGCCAPWIEACREYEDTGCGWICNG